MRTPRNVVVERRTTGSPNTRPPARRGRTIPFGEQPRAPLRTAPRTPTRTAPAGVITQPVMHGGREYTLRVFTRKGYAEVSGIIRGKMVTRKLDAATYNQIYVRKEPARTPARRTHARKSMAHTAVGMMANNSAVQSAVGHFIVQLLHHI